MENKNKKQEGVTLIALTVTIIVLLILSGVSLSLILGNNGIITKANKAKENYTIAQQSEENILDRDGEWIKQQLGEAEQLKINEKYEKKTIVKDEYNNRITIPEGFKIINDDDTTATHVPEGIVIADDEDNQFVWIPVGDVYTDTTKTNKKTITLGRYDFDSTGKTSPYSGTIIEEDSTDTANLKNYGNKIATDIKAFKNSANENHGYYIGRYEGRKYEDKSNSKICEDKTKKVYNNIFQQNGSTLCKNMYTNKSFTSDLMNGYAWDTALVFIETFENSNYANTVSAITYFAETGTNNITKKDKVQNIYDMGGNLVEYTTETGTKENPYIARGGDYYNQAVKTYQRLYNGNDNYLNFFTARPILIM